MRRPLEDWEYPEEDEEAEEVDLTRCPHCRSEVYAEAEQCPHCGNWIAKAPQGLTEWRGKPWWWILLGVVGVIAVLLTSALLIF